MEWFRWALALVIANAMRAEVEANTISGIRATISAGIAVSLLSETPLKHLIAQADAALYEAKAAGRNTCRMSRQAGMGVVGAEAETAA